MKHNPQQPDYKRQRLCEACWNNAHFSRDGISERKHGRTILRGKLISNCDNHKTEVEISQLQEERRQPKTTSGRIKEIDSRINLLRAHLDKNPCECHCRQMLNERPKRVKKDLRAQVPMFEMATVNTFRDDG